MSVNIVVTIWMCCVSCQNSVHACSRHLHLMEILVLPPKSDHSVITASLSAMCWRQTIFADTYCQDSDGELLQPALICMAVGEIAFRP